MLSILYQGLVNWPSWSIGETLLLCQMCLFWNYPSILLKYQNLFVFFLCSKVWCSDNMVQLNRFKSVPWILFIKLLTFIQQLFSVLWFSPLFLFFLHQILLLLVILSMLQVHLYDILGSSMGRQTFFFMVVPERNWHYPFLLFQLDCLDSCSPTGKRVCLSEGHQWCPAANWSQFDILHTWDQLGRNLAVLAHKHLLLCYPPGSGGIQHTRQVPHLVLWDKDRTALLKRLLQLFSSLEFQI